MEVGQVNGVFSMAMNQAGVIGQRFKGQGSRRGGAVVLRYDQKLWIPDMKKAA